MSSVLTYELKNGGTYELTDELKNQGTKEQRNLKTYERLLSFLTLELKAFSCLAKFSAFDK
jgi:hypothetical protein